MTETIETEKPARDVPDRHGLVWTVDEEQRLYDAFVAGTKTAEVATAHDRTRGGIRSHLKQLGLIDEDGVPITPVPEFTPTTAAVKRAAKALEKAAEKESFRVTRKAPEDEITTPTEINPLFAEALAILSDTRHSVFITGKAGTGKSTLLRHFRRSTQKNVVVLAPTGIAALNVGGQTIHNFFRFSIDVTPQKVAAKKKPMNARMYKKLDTIIIDEVSMVRADILDCIDVFLRQFGPHIGMPFGGVQMVFIGDLYQLPPVVGSQDREIFSSHYETPYFFSAHAMQDFDLQIVELQKIYRQKDRDFIALLNRVRNSTVTEQDVAHLNSRLNAVGIASEEAFTISLTATNQRADDINREHLAALQGRMYESAGAVKGEFGREYFPTTSELSFKIGAQVMMLNNDKEGRWVNGSIGVIESVRKDIEEGEYVTVRLQDAEDPVAIFKHTWEVYQFALADNQIQSEPVGTFTQYPFRLAWAVTIHKSQGKTFNRVTIDIGAGAFAAGQVYVALSRCTSFEGITLKTPIKRRHIQTDARIQHFMGVAVVEDDEMFAPQLTPPVSMELIEQAIRDKAPLDILYMKADDQETARTVYPRALGQHIYKDKRFWGMKAFDTTNETELLFSVDRILRIAAGRK